MGCECMEKNYRVTTFVMDSGERYCMVVDRASGLPMYYPTLFLTTQIRNKGNAFSTTLATANNLVLLLRFLDSRAINLEQRLLTKDFFKPHEMDDLRDFAQRKQGRMPSKALSTLWLDDELTNIVDNGTQHSRLTTFANRGCIPVGLHKPTNNFFNNDLTPREALDGKHATIFDRHGYYAKNGERVKLSSHQARHLLNTIAQRGGLSNLEIARWSGRADVKQNRTYNHMTEYELVGMAERLDPTKALFGPVGEVPKHLPVIMQEFNTLEHAAVHATEYGYCVHDYTMSPCEKFRDCVNCIEQVCIKGDDTEKLDRIKKRLEKSERLFFLADAAVESGEMGADRWYQYHKKTVTRLRELVAILENPDIENGAQIKLRGNDFSQLRRVAEKKFIEAIEKKGKESEEAVMLDNLKTLFGGGLG